MNFSFLHLSDVGDGAPVGDGTAGPAGGWGGMPVARKARWRYDDRARAEKLTAAGVKARLRSGPGSAGGFAEARAALATLRWRSGSAWRRPAHGRRERGAWVDGGGLIEFKDLAVSLSPVT